MDVGDIAGLENAGDKGRIKLETLQASLKNAISPYIMGDREVLDQTASSSEKEPLVWIKEKINGKERQFLIKVPGKLKDKAKNRRKSWWG